jgi:histidine ammonia-lyase
MLELDGQRLTLQEIDAVARGADHVALAPSARVRAEEARAVVEQNRG